MELKQVWMSRDTQKQSRYSLRTLGGILGIAMLALVLTLGGTVLGFMNGWPMRIVSVGLWLGVTVLLVALALRLGQNAVRDATLYFLTRDDRLFVADARQLAGMGHSALDWAKGTVRVQQRLREMARSPVLPAAAEEILRVEQIRENRTGYAVTCQLRRFDQTVTRRTCFVIRGLEDQETLLHLLELREGWFRLPGTPGKPYSARLIAERSGGGHCRSALCTEPSGGGTAPGRHLLPLPGSGVRSGLRRGVVRGAAAPGRMSGTRRRKMTCTKEELQEAKRQIDSTLHKLRETVRTLEGKENPSRYKSQITLANRRIQAFGLAVSLIERELEQLS